MPINKKSRNKCPVPGCEASNQPTEKRDSKEAHRFVLNCPKLHGMNRKECWDFYKESKCKCKKCFSTEHEWDSCPLQKNFPKFCKDKKKDGTICGGEHHERIMSRERKGPPVIKIRKPMDPIQNNINPKNNLDKCKVQRKSLRMPQRKHP